MKNNIWLLLGPELGKKNVFLRDQKALILSKKKSITQFKTFLCGFDTVTEICEYMSISSLFETEKAIVIKQIEQLTAAEARSLGKCIQNNSEDNIIFMVSDEVKVVRDLDIADSMQKKVFWLLNDSQYFHHIITSSRDKGLHFTRDAVDTLQYYGAENLAELDDFLQQISNYVQRNPMPSINAKHIEEWFTHYKRETVFTLFSSIAKQEYDNVFSTLKVLLKSGEKIQSIFSGLVYQFYMALQIVISKEKGIPFTKASEALNIRGITRQEPYKLFVKDINLQRMQDIYVLAVHSEAEIRECSLGISHEFLLSIFLYNVYQIHMLKRRQYKRFIFK